MPSRRLRVLNNDEHAAEPPPQQPRPQYLARTGRHGTYKKLPRTTPTDRGRWVYVEADDDTEADHGYTTSHFRALPKEPECVSGAILEDWEQVRRLHLSQQHAKDVAEALTIRPTMSIEDRVRDIQRRAKQGGYDLKRECALMWRDIERAQAGGRQPPARVYERAEGLEALLDGISAKAA